MAGISSQLQDYLSKSSKSSGPSGNNVTTSKGGYLNYFSKGNEADAAATDFDETSKVNGWFAEAQKDPLLPSLSKKQRVIGFVGCILMGTFCFSLASLYIPFLLLKARKFAMLYSMGSVFIISSFSLLWGPTNHFKHLLSGERLPFTSVYFGTMFATIYFAVWVKSTIFTIVFAVLQILALVWYIVSYIPGGKTGLSFFSRIFYSAASKTAAKTLPV